MSNRATSMEGVKIERWAFRWKKWHTQRHRGDKNELSFLTALRSSSPYSPASIFLTKKSLSSLCFEKIFLFIKSIQSWQPLGKRDLKAFLLKTLLPLIADRPTSTTSNTKCPRQIQHFLQKLQLLKTTLCPFVVPPFSQAQNLGVISGHSSLNPTSNIFDLT